MKIKGRIKSRDLRQMAVVVEHRDTGGNPEIVTRYFLVEYSGRRWIGQQAYCKLSSKLEWPRFNRWYEATATTMEHVHAQLRQHKLIDWHDVKVPIHAFKELELAAQCQRSSIQHSTTVDDSRQHQPQLEGKEVMASKFEAFVSKMNKAKSHETRVKYAADCPEHDDTNEESPKKMSVNRYLTLIVFPRPEVGTDEEIIEELRAAGVCSDKFASDDVTAKRNLAWAKNHYQQGKMVGQNGSTVLINQPYASNARRDNEETPPTEKVDKKATTKKSSKKKNTAKKAAGRK